MKPGKLLQVLALPLVAAAAGCNPDSPISVLFDPPECSITAVQKMNAVWPEPAIISVTVQNTTDATAYDVECEIKLKTGNMIVDEGLIYFGTLEAGEMMTGEARFWNISTHGDYANAAYHLFWYDSQGDYHD